MCSWAEGEGGVVPGYLRRQVGQQHRLEDGGSLEQVGVQFCQLRLQVEHLSSVHRGEDTWHHRRSGRKRVEG